MAPRLDAPRLVVWSGREWLEALLLDGVVLQRAANAAAVLDFAVVKEGALSFDEGAPVCLLVGDDVVFRGFVFGKQRQQPEVIRVRAYDQMRYLQNRDCCVMRNFTAGDMLRQAARANGLVLGDVVDTGYRLGTRSYDNRRYLDMLVEVLQETLVGSGRHYYVFDRAGKLCLQSCRDMQVDMLLDIAAVGGYDYATSIDDGFCSRVKVIYEDKRKAVRREFVAENRENMRKYGVLQKVSKSADAGEQTMELARQMLREAGMRGESLVLSEVPGDMRVRGGSMVGVRFDLGDVIRDEWMLVDRAEFRWKGGECLMEVACVRAENK